MNKGTLNTVAMGAQRGRNRLEQGDRTEFEKSACEEVI